MHVFIYKIKEFLRKNTKNILIIGGIIIVCFLIWYVFSGRENVSSNGVSTNDIRTELGNAQDTKSDITDTASDISNTSTDIAETVGNLAESIDTATGASSKFDAIIDECTGIIEQIRKQPAGE